MLSRNVDELIDNRKKTKNNGHNDGSGKVAIEQAAL